MSKTEVIEIGDGTMKWWHNPEGLSLPEILDFCQQYTDDQTSVVIHGTRSITQMELERSIPSSIRQSYLEQSGGKVPVGFKGPVRSIRMYPPNHKSTRTKTLHLYY